MNERETDLNEAVVFGGADKAVGEKVPVLGAVHHAAGVDRHAGDVLVVAAAEEPPVRLGDVLRHQLQYLPKVVQSVVGRCFMAMMSDCDAERLTALFFQFVDLPYELASLVSRTY